MKVLMVCLGNICRSPLAEGIVKNKARSFDLDWEVDSAGTSNWHSGEMPDKRSIEVAAKNGIDITDQRSRIITKKDIQYFDLILAMDSSNYNNILELCKTKEERNKVDLFLNYSFPGENRAVPDPYFDGGFDHVFHLLEHAGDRLIKSYLKTSAIS
jgi:protein-tyrosine phosphatase